MRAFPFSASIVAAVGFMGLSVAHAADIEVTVLNVASDAGTVQAALHDGDEGFPIRRTPRAVASVPAKAGAATLIFSDVTPGRYAIVVFHDQDGNDVLSTSSGRPNEPIGLSNRGTRSYGRPSFDKAAFDVGDETVSIEISLRQ